MAMASAARRRGTEPVWVKTRFFSFAGPLSADRPALHKQSEPRNIHHGAPANVIITAANSHARRFAEEP